MEDEAVFCNTIAKNPDLCCVDACVSSQVVSRDMPEENCSLQTALSSGCVISAGWGLLSFLPPFLSEPNPWSKYKQISIFSSKRLWISIWCTSWQYLRAGMTHIHLIISFYCSRGYKMAYVWITCPHWNETDLYFQWWQNFVQSFSVCIHDVSKVFLFAHTVLKIPDHRFEEQTKYLDFPPKTERTHAVTQEAQVPAP